MSYIPNNKLPKTETDYSAENTLKKILRLCEHKGITFTELTDAHIGLLSYEVFGLGGFMNPVNIISTPNEQGKLPVVKTGVNSNLLSKIGVGLRKLYLTT